MLKKALGTRALQVASSVALCTFAIASQADPVSLTGVCHLSSIIAGQARCDLNYQLWDDFATPGTVRKSLIKIDNIIVAQFVNDNVNPVDFAIALITGTTTVACGVNHTVTAFVAPVSVIPFTQVGTLLPVLCPTAP